MKKITFGLIILLSLNKHHLIKAQDIPLYALIDNKLVLVNSTTAQLETYKEIVELPPATNLSDLTYHSQKGVFYSIKDPSNAPTLVSISLEGEYHEIGNFTINGMKIKLSETLAFNQMDNKLYSAVSLNGGVQDNDFWSESIVTIDPLTGACTFVTEVMTNTVNPDIDAMAFSEGSLYLFDGAPPGANFSKFFKLDFDNVNSISNPQLIYDTKYIPITDFTILSQDIYFTEERNLHRFNLSNKKLELIGQLHSASESNGNIIQGISNLYSCQTPFVDLGNDTTLCTGESLLLDVTLSGASYQWQDGSTDPAFTVTEEGIYWVDITNAYGTCTERDSITVLFLKAPELEDTVVCHQEDVRLVLPAAMAGTVYHWYADEDSEMLLAEEEMFTTHLTQEETIFFISASNGSCESERVPYNVTFEAIPADAGKDVVIESGEEVQLQGWGGDTYQWYPEEGLSNPAIPNPVASPDTTTTYTLTATNAEGCQATDEVTVTVIEVSSEERINIPNVFTPNMDGTNDAWDLQGIENFPDCQVNIFDRWGMVVFSSQGYQNPWEGVYQGKLLPADVYFYVIDLGVHSEEVSSHSGTVTLIR